MKVVDGRVDHKKNPLGYYLDIPVFSWKVVETKGKYQTAARVRIAADISMKNVLYDSGMDPKADALAFAVPMELFPRKRYYWTVVVCTDAGEEAESEVFWFETGKMGEDWNAQWITCDNENTRHPIFEKKITPRKKLESARLYICGLGLYEAYIDGEKIGMEYLAPYSNNYNRWVQYQTYDVTEFLRENTECCLSVLLGNGWYKGRFGFQAVGEKGYYGDQWKLIAELTLIYEDQSTETFGTDENWQVRRSNIIYSSLYDGEQIDDTLPILPPEGAKPCRPPKGKLTERRSLPVMVHEKIVPVEILHTPSGETVLDLGQNFAGIFMLRVNEPRGTKIHIQTGEVLQDGNFYNGNLKTAKSEYIYISGGKETLLRPHFTYYGYRYVKVEGISVLKKEDFTGLALYSDMEMKGDVKTGHTLINRLIANVRWGMKSNFIDVPTDCPQRNERMGWTADTQVFVPTATFLADTYAFYTKYLYDLYTEQQDLDGKVPDVVPSAGVHSVSSVWGDAACIIPWQLWKFYGDKKILLDQYESMKAWVEYIRYFDGDNHGWRRGTHYGDWLSLDNPSGKEDEVAGATDEAYIADIYYAASAQILSNAAEILGKTEDQKIYQELSDHLTEEIKKEYFSANGRCCVKTQTALMLALKYHLSNDESRICAWLKELFEVNDNKLLTGFVGTPLMCPVLSEHGMSDLAYKLLLNEEYPGWLHEVKLGATTMWERWNSLDEDGKISSTGMNSLNHYAYGSVVEWIFAYAAGLRVDETHPGSRFLTIAPVVNLRLGYLYAVYEAPLGRYESGWEIIDPIHLRVKITIPFGCSAKVVLPEPLDREAVSLNPLFAEEYEDGYYVETGIYELCYTLKNSLKKKYTVDCTVCELMDDPRIMEKMGGMMFLERMPKRMYSMTMRQIMERFVGGEAAQTMLENMNRMLKEI